MIDHRTSTVQFTPLRRLLIAALLVTLTAVWTAGCGATTSVDPAAATGPPQHGGTAWMETSQEPPVLNSWLGIGGMSITDVITTPLKSQWLIIDDHGAWQPLLATRVPTLANGLVRETPAGGMTIDFDIDRRAIWSDGVPITCADMRFTWKTAIDQRWGIGSRLGWELVTAVQCSSPKHVTMVLRERYAPYLSMLLGTAPLPQHALADADFNRVWNNRITVSSGPFVFDHWKRGKEIVMRRNPRWWKPGPDRRPYLDKLVVRFATDANTMKLDLRMQDTDIIGLPADTNLPEELESIRTAQHDIRNGGGWENITLNTVSGPTADVRVRQAIAYTIDRRKITDVVLRGQVSVLNSTLLPAQKPFYTPVFQHYVPNQSKVDGLMQAAGYAMQGGRWMRNGKPARLTLATMSGNPLRSKVIQLVQAQLERAGFAVDLVVSKPEVFFGQIISHGNFELALYSFTQGVDPSQTKYFACSEIAREPEWRGKNNAHWCRRDVDRLMLQADATLDIGEKARLSHQVQQRIADDVPVIPLFVQPDTLAWDNRLHGVRPNAMGRHLWTIDQWWVDQ